jgi:Flp pilus assembly CpaF family ATPase
MIDVGAMAREVRLQVGAALAQERRVLEESGRPPRAPAEERARADELTRAVLEERALATLRTGNQPPPLDVDEAVRQQVLAALFGVGGLQPLLDDERIESIEINGADSVWARYADGTRARRDPVAGSDEELIDLIRRLAASGLEERRFDRASPRLNLALADGSRLFATMVVTPRPVAVIRRHRYRRISLHDLTTLGMISEDLRGFLAAAVGAGRNIMVSGAPGVGKTTFVRALAAELPWDAHIVTIEDPVELALDRDGVHAHVTAMQPRGANIEGHGEITLADLVRDALRMNPDHLIVGEVRGSEVTPMLIAMSAGTRGSMSTIHAYSSAAVCDKVIAYAGQSRDAPAPEATARLVAQTVHLIVHLDRVAGRRVVASIREVAGPAEHGGVATNEIWTPGPDGSAVLGPAPMSQGLLAALRGADPTGTVLPVAPAPVALPARPAFAPLEDAWPPGWTS